jgi:hypothetical protein
MESRSIQIIPQTAPERDSMTLRLTPRLSIALDRYRQVIGVAKTAVIVTALEEYLSAKEQQGGFGLFQG